MLPVSLLHMPGDSTSRGFKPQPLSTKSLRLGLLLGCTHGGPWDMAGLQEGPMRADTRGTGVELSCQGHEGLCSPDLMPLCANTGQS